MKAPFRNKQARQDRIARAIARTEVIIAAGGGKLPSGASDLEYRKKQLAELQRGLARTTKKKLLPLAALNKIAAQDDLVAAIVKARGAK